MAKEMNVGVVCSGHEAKNVRKIIGKNLLIFTPGIRMINDNKNDQQRICTPLESMKNGSDKIPIFFIKSNNFEISAYSKYSHLDYKYIDAQNTGLSDGEFDYVVASNMIHHLPYPIKFFNEMHRILKKNGKLIIFDAHYSVLLQSILILMKHEGFDFTKNVWDEKSPATDEKDLWSGNSANPYLLFNNKTISKKISS